MKLGIIGGGVVGRATARCFIEHVDDVLVWDKRFELTTALLREVVACDLVIVCVPETVLDELFSMLVSGGNDCESSEFKKDTNLVLRSTVPVGTTRRLAYDYDLPNLVHWPEFLTARCSLTDAQLPARNVIGTVDEDNHPAASLLMNLLECRFPGVPIHLMTSNESEAVKLIQNAFFAVKVAFFNEAFRFCEAWGISTPMDWDRVLAAVLADGRIAHSHTKVPGPDGKYGFGGACLPKDLWQWIQCVQVAGQKPLVAMAAHTRNEEDRKRAN